MIGRHDSELEERNVFLQLALGLISASHRLDRILSRHGRSEPGPRHASRNREDEQLVHFVLGVVSFRARVMAALETARRSSRPAKAPSPSPRAPLSGLLR